jgi:hypothetical protein
LLSQLTGIPGIPITLMQDWRNKQRSKKINDKKTIYVEPEGVNH